MGQKVTIGGDRLGAGGKMKVALKSYQRSTHDLGYLWRSSMAPGTLVPFMVQVALPGDTFDIDLNADVKTHPTLGPLFGSFKLQLDIFEAPLRLYHPALMQNTTQIGNNAQNVLLPVFQSDVIPITTPNQSYTAPDNTQINPSALLKYLGISGWGTSISGASNQRKLNCVPFLAYWEIYKNYYANKQETIGSYLTAIVGGPTTITSINVNGSTLPQNNPGAGIPYAYPETLLISFTGSAPLLSQIVFNTNNGTIKASDLGSWSGTASTFTLQSPINATIFYSWAYITALAQTAIATFPLTAIDNVKSNIMQANPALQFLIQSGGTAPYGPSMALANTTLSQNGLALKTYQSDLFNNWMQTSWYTSIQTATAISTAGNINVDTIILAKKVYELLTNIAIAGGTYHDWVNAVYDHEPYSICNTPIYHGGLSKEVIFQEVVSLAQQPQQPLGTLAGRGQMSHKHKGGKIRIKIHEPGYLIGIVSLTPRLDYSQGNAWHTYGIQTLNDFHKPALDGIGFQNLLTEQMAWWDTQWNSGVLQQPSAGFQPAWTNYMTEVNKTYGNFALPTNEMFMTLNRRYQMNPVGGHILDLTTYIDPSHYNFIFAQTNLDAQNFWVQIAVDNTARRKMSAKIMPNL